MKLSNAMKQRVEQYWDELKKEDYYNQAILSGSASPEMVSHFLVNVRYLVQHTPVHLKKAYDLSISRNLSRLAQFFQQKLEEEQGHDQWADADLAKLERRLKKPPVKTDIHYSMKKLIQHIENTINQDPHLYLAYIFFAEYLCVVCGPEMTSALQNQCGFPPQSLTVVENHAELDKDHVHEWEEVIEEIIDEKVYKSKFMSYLEETISLHKEFFASCGEGAIYAAS